MDFGNPSRMPAAPRRLLAVFDGGDAPGYSSIAVALTEEGTRRGFEVWAATEGFRSLTEDATSEPRFERLVVGRRERYQLLAQGVPTRSMGRRVTDPGSDFRSERYLGFFERAKQEAAATTIRHQGFTHVVCVGGNGTFEGTKALTERLGHSLPMGFVNVSIDNDVGGDRAIGFTTGVEVGSTVARGLYDDSFTHKRVYLLELMGNRSGRHALMCGVASRAHLIVLPFFSFPDDVLAEVADEIGRAEYALIVVAQGYELERRKRSHGDMGASAFLKLQLEAYGLRDRPDRRVIAEPFSRYLRGVRPGFSDVAAAYLKVSTLFDAFEHGQTEVMPFVLAAHDVGVRKFDDVAREDRVERSLLPLLARLKVPRFRAWIRDNFATGDTSY